MVDLITPQSGPAGRGASGSDAAERFACPVCRGPLAPMGPDRLRCEPDRLDFDRIDGIWRFLPAARLAHFARFMREYELVREREGRGSHDAAFYRALPFADRSGHFGADWQIRARSFAALIDQVLAPLEAERDGPLLALDLGAGNGWLSHRLAQRGHEVLAVDLLTNTAHGLGAHVHYAHSFTPVQAEFDHLPLANAQADLVVFNGALHYASDIELALAEALRVLRPDGRLVIMDTPVYRDPASGRAMVREREAHFTRTYGFPSNAVPMEGYLTFQRLEALGARLGLHWHMIQPHYGLAWALRPWRARLRRQREPARFLVVAGVRVPGRGRPPCLPSSRFSHRLAVMESRGQTRGSAPTAWSRRAFDWQKRQVWRRVLQVRQRVVRGRQRRVVLERAAELDLVVLPGVFNPVLLRSGALFADMLSRGLVAPGATVLDLGTGSGIAALAAARVAERVVAVDVNPEAVRCARANALLNGVERRVEVRQGDLFTSLDGERFDLILFNPPYYRGVPRDLADHAWRSPDVAERFAADLAAHLTPDGSALVILSSDGDPEIFLAACRSAGLTIEAIAQRDLINEAFTLYRISPHAHEFPSSPPLPALGEGAGG